MKKLLLLGIVSAFCSSVLAAGHIELRIAPEDVNLGGYQASETVTIQIYATDFYTDYPNDTIGFIDIAAVLTDNGGTASEPNLHPKLEGFAFSAGTIVNSGGVLIEDIHGNKGLDLVGVYPFPAVLWECEFHIPDVPPSSVITISLSGLELKTVTYKTITPAYTVGEPLEIRSPCCPGDCEPEGTGDGDIDSLDFSLLAARLKKARKATGLLYISPTDPCAAIRALWSPCLDCEPWGVGDGDVDSLDYSMLASRLKKARKITGLLYISPTDPCEMIRALWPCDWF